MEYLRRLAPSRETQAPRVIAALPSRFERASPLREPPERTDAEPESVEADGWQFAPRSRAESDRAESRAAGSPRAGANEPRAEHAPIRSDSELPLTIDRVEVAPSKRRVEPITNARKDNNAAPLQQYLRPSIASSRQSNATSTSAHPARAAAPLSQEVLAERAQQSKNDDQIVHVTIGRIDVIANTAPAPVARRAPTPRGTSVSLADYLRGDTGTRR